MTLAAGPYADAVTVSSGGSPDMDLVCERFRLVEILRGAELEGPSHE